MAPSSIPGSLRAPHEQSLWAHIRQVERRQWWLWASAIVVTLLLTAGMASFSFLFEPSDSSFSLTLRDSVRGLVALVFLFDLYTIYQQLQIHRIRRKLTDQEEMFRLISENAEDLITVIDREGQRLYNSPAYERIFGYSKEDLEGMPVLDQVHPDDHETVLAAGEETFQKGMAPRVGVSLPAKGWGMANPGIELQARCETIEVKSKRSWWSAAILRSASRPKNFCGSAKQQLRQAQKMEAVGRLSGGIAHDFNNLLGSHHRLQRDHGASPGPEDPLRKSAEKFARPESAPRP